MNSIDSGSLYFNAAQQAAQAQMQSEQAKRKDKSEGLKKSSFGSVMQEQAEKSRLISMGLPPEIAGMDEEQAVVFLKDELDAAGDAISINATPEAFDRYKKAVGNMMNFFQKTNYLVASHKRFGKTRKGKPRDPAIEIIAIDEKLNKLANDIWYNHLDKLKLLERIHEINGLIVDLMAA